MLLACRLCLFGEWEFHFRFFSFLKQKKYRLARSLCVLKREAMIKLQKFSTSFFFFPLCLLKDTCYLSPERTEWSKKKVFCLHPSLRYVHSTTVHFLKRKKKTNATCHFPKNIFFASLAPFLICKQKFPSWKTKLLRDKHEMHSLPLFARDEFWSVSPILLSWRLNTDNTTGVLCKTNP